jgi:hypothetical protein
VVLVALGLGYCALQAPPKPKMAPIADLATDGDEEGAASDPDEASDRGEMRGGETYPQYDERRDALDAGLYSGGDECTVDCSGHDAGRRWAEEHGITDPSQCGGKSWSFAEGCRSFAGEQSGGSDTDASEDSDE